MALVYYLTHINIDFGARSLLAAECERVGIKKPLIVTRRRRACRGRAAEGARCAAGVVAGAGL